MALCEQCGNEVVRLTCGPELDKQICKTCADAVESFPFSDEELNALEQEKRANIRVPIAVGMHFHVGKMDRIISYPATTMNISTSGICFAWDACETCTGYARNSVDKKCFFYPYSTAIKAKKREDIELTLAITSSQRMQFHVNVIYTLKEENLNVEYIGCIFVKQTPMHTRFLESLLVKYGS